MEKFTIAMLVTNHFGVLTRVSGLFSRRGFNIDTLTVGETQDPSLSRMTITMTGDSYAREQIIKQLKKLHDVKKIKIMDSRTSVARELILIKVAATAKNRQDILDAAKVFRNKVIDFSPESICMEITGESGKLDAFIELMEHYQIIEMCRTGVVSLDRGAASL